MVRCVSRCHPFAQLNATLPVHTGCNAPHDYWYLSRRVEYHVYSLKEDCFGSKIGSVTFKTAEGMLHVVCML